MNKGQKRRRKEYLLVQNFFKNLKKTRRVKFSTIHKQPVIDSVAPVVWECEKLNSLVLPNPF